MHRQPAESERCGCGIEFTIPWQKCFGMEVAALEVKINLEDTPQSLKKDIEVQLLSLYDFEKEFEVSLLKYSENIIYKISFQTMAPVVFRVHRPAYHDYEELKGEMTWMEEIHRDTDVSLPVVYSGRDGELLQKMKTSSGAVVYCSVISFLHGKALGELRDNDLLINMEQLGEITAKLHLQSIGRDKSVVIKRFSWDVENFFGINAGVWGTWRDYPGIDDKQFKILEDCESEIIKQLDIYGRVNEHYGLIHGDLHFFNIINDNGKNQLIDFDDSGYGFYMYDCGCSLVTYSGNIKLLMEAWLRGYERVRRLAESDKKLLPMFILLRRIVRLAWLSTHADSDTARTVEKDYKDITVDMAESWLKEIREVLA